MKQIKLMKEQLLSGKFDEQLKKIYVDEGKITYQRKRYENALESYEKVFGAGEVEVFSAPGRSEVGGNHTDHQHGMVLATSINLDAIAVVGLSSQSVIKIMSKGYGVTEVDIDNLECCDSEAGTTTGLIRGVLAGFKERGYYISGFNAYVTSDVLGGAGLSSSAAFEVLVGTILSILFNESKVDAVEIAQIAQYAENVYFKKPCGLMDQMACSVGGLIHIDFKDKEKPREEKVEIDFEAYHYSLCIVDTKGSHENLTEDYAFIPQEMKKAANYFGKQYLREVTEAEFYQAIKEVREATGDRAVLRAIHFFEEDKRVQLEVDALREGNFKLFLDTVKESGNSSFKYLQNVYTNKDLQNQSVSIGLAVSESILGEHGVSRVHGGGFAGTIQAFVANDFVEAYKKGMDAVYGEGSCHVLKVRPFGGCRVL